MQNTNENPIIEVKKLSTAFDGLYIHKDLDLAIYPNRIITIIGDSGCGKTTLIRAILMLQPIVSGEIYIAGQQVLSLNADDPHTKFLLSRVGMMFQHGALFSSSTVLENVMFPLLEYTDFSKETIREIAWLKLKIVGLPETAFNNYPNELSGGMAKRVALARTLALDPNVIFLDEPTNGLDANSASQFDELISDLRQQLSLTVVMVTHDLDSIWGISDEIVFLGDKKVLYHDSVENAANNKSIPQLYEYFNGPRGLVNKQFYLHKRENHNDKRK